MWLILEVLRYVALMWMIMMRSGPNFAHDTTAQLSWHVQDWYTSTWIHMIQGSFFACAQPVRDEVTMWRLSLAGRIHKMISAESSIQNKVENNFCKISIMGSWTASLKMGMYLVRWAASDLFVMLTHCCLGDAFIFFGVPGTINLQIHINWQGCQVLLNFSILLLK